MIHGLFRFVFVEVPIYVFETLTDWFPNIWKFIHVLLLAVVGAAIVFAPFLIVGYRAYQQNSFTLNLWSLLTGLSTFELSVAFLWLFVACVGSVWGIIRLRRKSNRRLRELFLFKRQ